MDRCRHAIVRLVISERRNEKEVIQLRPFIFSEFFSPERAAIFEFSSETAAGWAWVEITKSTCFRARWSPGERIHCFLVICCRHLGSTRKNIKTLLKTEFLSCRIHKATGLSIIKATTYKGTIKQATTGP